MVSLFKKKSVVPAEPDIIEIEEPIQAIGIEMETSSKKAFRDIAKLNQRFEHLKQIRKIPNRKSPWAFVAISSNYDEVDLTFNYSVGEVVTSTEEIPGEYTAFEIPAIKYAVFNIRPGSRFTRGLNILKTKKYAFTQWLPQSEYLPARIIDDFEWHDERSTRKKSAEIDLYVAIKEVDDNEVRKARDFMRNKVT